jgi:ubiquinone/menaquinone biosynthesis C-methylase UbiE
MDIRKEILQYWEKNTPMGFASEELSYEEKRKFRYSLQDYMHEAFRFEDWAGRKVLEVGCGSGIDAVEFARHGAIVTATDITDNAVELTRALAREAGVEITVVQAPAHKIPHKDGTFDCVYCFGVLHHIPDVETALAEIYRVLKSGGRVMAMLYHRDSLLYAYSIIYWRGVKEGMLGTLTPEQLVSRYSERNEGCPYTRAYTKDEARNLFSPWFKQITTEVHYNVLDLPEQRKVKVDIPDTYELGWHLIVKAVK